MSEKKRVTIYDIAREAGVSAATVSRVITGSAEVSDIKREKVLALIHQYHFRPNALAKGLSMTQSGLLGMLQLPRQTRGSMPPRAPAAPTAATDPQTPFTSPPKAPRSKTKASRTTAAKTPVTPRRKKAP